MKWDLNRPARAALEVAQAEVPKGPSPGLRGPQNQALPRATPIHDNGAKKCRPCRAWVRGDETPSARGLRRLGLGYRWCRSKELEGRPPADCPLASVSVPTSWDGWDRRPVLWTAARSSEPGCSLRLFPGTEYRSGSWIVLNGARWFSICTLPHQIAEFPTFIWRKSAFPGEAPGVLRLAAAFPIPAGLTCTGMAQGGSKLQHSEGACGAR